MGFLSNEFDGEFATAVATSPSTPSLIEQVGETTREAIETGGDLIGDISDNRTEVKKARIENRGETAENITETIETTSEGRQEVRQRRFVVVLLGAAAVGGLVWYNRKSLSEGAGSAVKTGAKVAGPAAMGGAVAGPGGALAGAASALVSE